MGSGNLRIEVHLEGQVKGLARSERSLDTGPLATVAVNHILNVTFLAIGVLIVTINVSGMRNSEVIPCSDVISSNMILEAVVTRNEGLLVINLTDADYVRQLNAIARLNGFSLPAEAHTAVVVAILFHIVFIDLVLKVVAAVPCLILVLVDAVISTYDFISLVVVPVLSEPIVIGGSNASNASTKESTHQRSVFGIGILQLQAIGVILMSETLDRSIIVVTDHDVGPNASADGHGRVVVVGQGVNDACSNLALGLDT